MHTPLGGAIGGRTLRLGLASRLNLLASPGTHGTWPSTCRKNGVLIVLFVAIIKRSHGNTFLIHSGESLNECLCRLGPH